MKISNKNKDKMTIIGILGFTFLVLFLIVYFFIAVVKLFAITEFNYTENLTEQEQINKFYTEEALKNEMYLLSCWKTIDEMSDEEYFETFLKE